MLDTPAIYVRCLASEARGSHHGAWLTLGQAPCPQTTLICLRAAIDDLIAGSPTPGADEWDIIDFECFGTLTFDRFVDLETLAYTGWLIHHYCPDATSALYTYANGELARVHALLNEQSYLGCFSNLKEIGEYLIDSCDIEAWLLPYIDYASYARDTLFGGEHYATVSSPDGLHLIARNDLGRRFLSPFESSARETFRPASYKRARAIET